MAASDLREILLGEGTRSWVRSMVGKNHTMGWLWVSKVMQVLGYHEKGRRCVVEDLYT